MIESKRWYEFQDRAAEILRAEFPDLLDLLPAPAREAWDDGRADLVEALDIMCVRIFGYSVLDGGKADHV